MTYLIKEDIVLRAKTMPPSDLERYSPANHAWVPYAHRYQDLEFVQSVPVTLAVQQLQELGVPLNEAQQAVR